ncbi:MAG: hypothetical protein ACE5DM_02395 [Candidatus Nanoarchaeia archaeon]
MNNKVMKRVMLFILFILIAALLSTVVFADLKSSISGAGAKVKGVFSFNASSPGFVDFLLFFVIFMSLTWIGLSKWFEGGGGASKGGVIGLAVGMSLGLSAALVYGAKWGIAKLLPFAFIFLGVILFIALYALMNRMIGGDSTGRKIFAFIIAAILTVLVLSLVLGSGICDKSPILSRICGSDSVFNKFGSLGEGWGGGKTAPEKSTSTASEKKGGKGLGDLGKQCLPLKLGQKTPADCYCVKTEECPAGDMQNGVGKCIKPYAPCKRKPLTKSSELPPIFKNDLEEIRKAVDEAEGKLNRGKSDADADKIRAAIGDLEIQKSRLMQLRQNIASAK